ncbi:hypothetical protein HanRHA438_Chr16g0741431 [Helianthus annuus]|nr:hypothetical protein HanRHA438_Chr16g0741431 [Helianthus annuus]
MCTERRSVRLIVNVSPPNSPLVQYVIRPHHRHAFTIFISVWRTIEVSHRATYATTVNETSGRRHGPERLRW